MKSSAWSMVIVGCLSLGGARMAFAACVGGAPDGVKAPQEACDDGNTSNTDNCLSDCTLPFCGDGHVRTAGACDGNPSLPCTVDGDCTGGAKCTTEFCDDGNTVDCDACTRCAFGPPTGCGDGIVCGTEVCDDGNTLDTDNCLGDCTLPSCGDGHVRTTGACNGDPTKPCTSDANCTGGAKCTVETCDDGNTMDGDGCDSNCTVTGCGNGIVTAGEECDDGNSISGDASMCDANCTHTRCGNGIVTTGELCDDGNTSSLDGCSADCCTEPPGPSGATSADKFNAMKCLRTTLKAEIAVLAMVPPHRRDMLGLRIDRVARQEDRAKAAVGRKACGPLRYAAFISGGVQRRLDIESGFGHIPVADYLQLSTKISLLRGWYSTQQSGLGCSS